MVDFSIIIPHKNIPDLLQRCLDSIPQREDLEIIVVDDNSDVDIVDFENFPGNNRNDVTVIFDKIGNGAGRARNVGLRQARGKWIIFADADDFFTYCFNKQLDYYKDSSADVIYFCVSSVDSETYVNSNRADAFNYFFIQYLNGNLEAENFIRYIVSAPWAKFIKRKLITDNHIECEETSKYDDVQISYLLGYYAQNILVDRHAIYCLTERMTSLSTTNSKEKLFDNIRVFARREQFLKEHNIPVPEGNSFAFLEALVNIADSGDNKLYQKCLKELSALGFSQSTIDQMVNQELLNRKKGKKNESNIFFCFIKSLFGIRR
jgi:glycosyltransferase involved in cell wall biosynthesis